MERDLLRRETAAKSDEGSPEFTDPRRKAIRWTEVAWRIAALPLILYFLIPIIMLFTRLTPQALLENLKSEVVHQAMVVSMRSTLVSLGLILLFGTPLAYLMGRRQFRYKKALDTLIDLPTVLPPSVAGVALLMTFGRRGFIGSWLDDLGIQIAFSITAVIMAQTFVAAPFYVRAATLGFAGIEEEMEQAAQLDGAGRWQVFRYILLPLSRFALLGGAMMSWARALGEFGATILFAGNFQGRTQTLTTAIYLGFERDLESALTISVILVSVSFLSLLLIKILVSVGND